MPYRFCSQNQFGVFHISFLRREGEWSQLFPFTGQPGTEQTLVSGRSFCCQRAGLQVRQNHWAAFSRSLCRLSACFKGNFFPLEWCWSPVPQRPLVLDVRGEVYPGSSVSLNPVFRVAVLACGASAPVHSWVAHFRILRTPFSRNVFSTLSYILMEERLASKWAEIGCTYEKFSNSSL